MNWLSMRTVMFSHVITDVLDLIVIELMPQGEGLCLVIVVL